MDSKLINDYLTNDELKMLIELKSQLENSFTINEIKNLEIIIELIESKAQLRHSHHLELHKLKEEINLLKSSI